MPKPRVCAVSFLNTVPLAYGMAHGPQRSLVDLTFAVPSVCAERVETGHADVGLVPVIEMDRQGLTAVPGIGIASRGAVPASCSFRACPSGACALWPPT